MSDKTSGNMPVFSSCLIYTVPLEIRRYLEIPLVEFCETSHSGSGKPYQTLQNYDGDGNGNV